MLLGHGFPGLPRPARASVQVYIHSHRRSLPNLQLHVVVSERLDRELQYAEDNLDGGAP